MEVVVFSESQEPFKIIFNSLSNSSFSMATLRQFFEDCYHGNYDRVVGFLKNNSDKVSQTDVAHEGSTALIYAAETGNLDIVRLLVEDYSVDVNQCDDLGQSPLYAACQAGQLKVVEYLLSISTDRNLKTSCGETPVHVTIDHSSACACKDRGNMITDKMAVLTLLWNNNFNMTDKDNAGWTPILIAINDAVSTNSLTFLKFLIETVGIKVDLKEIRDKEIPLESNAKVYQYMTSQHNLTGQSLRRSKRQRNKIFH